MTRGVPLEAVQGPQGSVFSNLLCGCHTGIILVAPAALLDLSRKQTDQIKTQHFAVPVALHYGNCDETCVMKEEARKVHGSED